MKEDYGYKKKSHKRFRQRGFALLRDIILAAKRRTELGTIDVEQLARDCYDELKLSMMKNDYISEHDVALLIPSLTMETLRNLRRKNLGPRYAKLGFHRSSRIVYRGEDIYEWLEHATVETEDTKLWAHLS